VCSTGGVGRGCAARGGRGGRRGTGGRGGGSSRGARGRAREHRRGCNDIRRRGSRCVSFRRRRAARCAEEFFAVGLAEEEGEPVQVGAEGGGVVGGMADEGGEAAGEDLFLAAR